MWKSETPFLFGKYQLSCVIGQGRSGTVYLAVHRELEEKRAIKRVPKTFVNYEQFRREALLLKELRHPGIPIVYDLEEDSDYSYLIEEYLEGDSLYDLVKDQGHLSQETVIRYGIQICDLVNYLHIAEAIPILYLDLQPKNLLLCHETVKLIDFDHAASLSEANEASARFGTPGFCAPEQMDERMTLDIRTDVYAIGCMLAFMRTGMYPGAGQSEVPEFPVAGRGMYRAGEKRFWHVVRTCLREHKEERYQTAEEVKQALEELVGHGMDVFKKNQSPSLTIALIGSKSGVGTTHLGISLSSYLKKSGYPNLYEERHPSGAVRQIAGHEGAKADSCGIVNVKGVLCKPWYGAAVRLKEHPYALVVRDYGTDFAAWHRDQDAHMTFLVCGGAWWDLSENEEAVRQLQGCRELGIIYNHPIPGVRIKNPENVPGNRCFRMPFFADPFQTNPQTERCWKGIMDKAWNRAEGGGSLRGFLRRITGRICRRIVSSV